MLTPISEKALKAVKEDRTTGVKVSFITPSTCAKFFKYARASKILTAIEVSGSAVTSDSVEQISPLLINSTTLTYLAIREARFDQKSLQGNFRKFIFLVIHFFVHSLHYIIATALMEATRKSKSLQTLMLTKLSSSMDPVKFGHCVGGMLLHSTKLTRLDLSGAHKIRCLIFLSRFAEIHFQDID